MVFPQQSSKGFHSIYTAYRFNKNRTEPAVRDVACSTNQPVPREDGFSKEFSVGPARLLERIKLGLGEGHVQFGADMHQQASGVFIGTAPAPELANDFASLPEFKFLGRMIGA